MQSMLMTAGRVLYAIPFGVFGVFHFLNPQVFRGMVPGLFPGPAGLWVYITGVIMLLGAASLLSQKYVREASLLLAFMLLVFILTIWIPALRNPEMQQVAMPTLLRDTALLGAALAFAAADKKQAMHKDSAQVGAGGQV